MKKGFKEFDIRIHQLEIRGTRKSPWERCIEKRIEYSSIGTDPIGVYIFRILSDGHLTHTIDQIDENDPTSLSARNSGEILSAENSKISNSERERSFVFEHLVGRLYDEYDSF